MEYKVDFTILAHELGGHFEEISMPNGAVNVETKWGPEEGRAFLRHFDEIAKELAPGTQVVSNGHTDPWAMIGMLYRLRHCQLGTYLSMFNYVAPIEAYATGDRPADGQPVLFQIKREGDNVFLALKAGTPQLPMKMRLSQMNCPAIQEGSNVFVELLDAKTLHLLAMAPTLGELCKTLYVKQDTGVYRCAISHVDGINPGDDIAI